MDLSSGVEELRRRLEVLLGARPEAPVDESEKARVQTETERLARRERMATAAGQMLTAALTMLGELAPSGPADEHAERMARAFEASLRECVESDEQGRLRLTVMLPSGAESGNGASTGLSALARSLARLTAMQAASLA